jgi:hypothetical protein
MFCFLIPGIIQQATGRGNHVGFGKIGFEEQGIRR